MNNNVKDTKSQELTLMRIQTILIACILILLVVVGVAAAMKFQSIQTCIDTIQQSVETIDTDAFNQAVNALTDAANQFSKIDMDTLNETVAGLDSAAAELKGVDVASLNSLVSALESVATRLQNTVNAISGFFGR